MRQHVTVALSGDGGDEGFGGYRWHRDILRVARAAKVPPYLSRLAAAGLRRLSGSRLVSPGAALALGDLAGADDPQILEYLLTWVGPSAHADLCVQEDVLPVRRHFESQWEHRHSGKASRAERIFSLGAEVGTRLILANDYLPKVDVASMKESLEVRVPMLDEDLFEFALSLPHELKVRGSRAKVVLRAVAERQLPASVASKPKHGFGVPVDTWVDAEFKAQTREALLGPESKLPEFFRKHAYRPLVSAFCEDRSVPSLSRQELFQRVTMMLAVHLALENAQARRTRPQTAGG
jgi:asparagine synthase (glutamine-hydrolysing)